MRRKLLPTSPSLISYDLREVNNHIVVLAFFSLVAFRFIVKLSISSFRLAQYTYFCPNSRVVLVTWIDYWQRPTPGVWLLERCQSYREYIVTVNWLENGRDQHQVSVLERCLSFREYSHSRMTEKWQEPTPGAHLIESIQLTPENSNPRWLKPRANLNQSRFPLDFLLTFTVILPSATRTLDNSNLPLTRSNFCFPSAHFYTILPSITRTML